MMITGNIKSEMPQNLGMLGFFSLIWSSIRSDAGAQRVGIEDSQELKEMIIWFLFLVSYDGFMLQRGALLAGRMPLVELFNSWGQ